MLEEWAQRVLDELKTAEQWLTDHPLALTVLLALPVGAFLKWLIGLGTNAPHIQFGLDNVDEIHGDRDIGIVLRLTNDGGSTASNVRVTWVKRSSCEMKAVPRGFSLVTGEHRLIELSVAPVVLIRRMGQNAEWRTLGLLEVTYQGKWCSRRDGRALIIPRRDADLAHGLVELAPLPGKRLRDVIPQIGKFMDERRAKQAAHKFDDWVASSNAFLVQRGISIDPDEDDEAAFKRLLGELQRRGWQWKYESGGRGYELVADKTWPPSTSLQIHFDAATRTDVAALVLARAIEADEEHAGHGPA